MQQSTFINRTSRDRQCDVSELTWSSFCWVAIICTCAAGLAGVQESTDAPVFILLGIVIFGSRGKGLYLTMASGGLQGFVEGGFHDGSWRVAGK